MIKALSWNIKSVNTQSAFERLKLIKSQYNLSFICLQEPFTSSELITSYMRHLGIEGSHFNTVILTQIIKYGPFGAMNLM